MIRFWNFVKLERIARVTVADRILEMLSLMLVICMVVLSILFYQYAPEQIPIHFNAAGVADGWGGKGEFFFVMFMGILVIGLCNYAAYNHKLVNLPIRLKPECLPQQLTLLGRMMRILALVLGMLFLTILCSMAAPQLGIRTEDWSFVPLIWLLAMLVLLIVYSVKIWKVGRDF